MDLRFYITFSNIEVKKVDFNIKFWDCFGIGAHQRPCLSCSKNDPSSKIMVVPGRSRRPCMIVINRETNSIPFFYSKSILACFQALKILECYAILGFYANSCSWRDRFPDMKTGSPVGPYSKTVPFFQSLNLLGKIGFTQEKLDRIKGKLSQLNDLVASKEKRPRPLNFQQVT